MHELRIDSSCCQSNIIRGAPNQNRMVELLIRLGTRLWMMKDEVWWDWQRPALQWVLLLRLEGCTVKHTQRANDVTKSLPSEVQ